VATVGRVWASAGNPFFINTSTRHNLLKYRILEPYIAKQILAEARQISDPEGIKVVGVALYYTRPLFS
jgi:hypothetical protein